MIRLVLSIIQRFTGRRESGWVVDDLFQVGCIGLVKAVDNFDPAREVMFSTYAVPMILGEVRRFLRDSAAVRISRSTRDLAYRVMSLPCRAGRFSAGACPADCGAKAALNFNTNDGRKKGTPTWISISDSS